MARRGLIADLGDVMQLAFVPDDFDAAIQYWTGVMGVGPFYMIENIQLANMKYRGEPSDAVFSLALAYWGDLQIELIRPENSAPSIYTGDYAQTNGVHHVCILVDDIGKAREICAKHGAEAVLEGAFGASQVIYVDPGPGKGHLIEILQQDKSGPDLFGIIKAASVGWDGRDPIRTFGQ